MSGATRARSVVIGLAALMVACDQGSPLKPTSLSPPPPVPVSTYVVSGLVTEPVGLPLVGATVAVVSGTGEGNSARTGEGGGYGLPGVKGAVTLRYTADGYVTTTRQLMVERNQLLDVELAPLVESMNVEGRWRATFEAHADCTQLPSAFRTRRYDVAIVQQGARVAVEFSGPGLKGQTLFQGLVHGDRLTVQVIDDSWGATGITESVGEGQSLILFGHVSARVTKSRMTGVFDGAFYLGSDVDPYALSCESVPHRVRFDRR
jgi:hypothetical protein